MILRFLQEIRPKELYDYDCKRQDYFVRSVHEMINIKRKQIACRAHTKHALQVSLNAVDGPTSCLTKCLNLGSLFAKFMIILKNR